MEGRFFILRLRRLVGALEASSGLSEIEDAARPILDFIAEAECESRSLRMTDIVKVREFGTPPTVYARLAGLQEAGWIEAVPDNEDRRVRLVSLTAAARSTFARISDEAHSLSKEVFD